MLDTINIFFTNPIFSKIILNNSLKQWMIALIAFIAFILGFKIFQSIIIYKLNKLAKKTKTDIDDTLIQIVKTLKPPFYLFLSFYLSLRFVLLEDKILRVINVILIIWVVYQIIKSLHIAIDYTIKKAMTKDKMVGSKDILSLFSKISKGILWILGLLVVLSNLGINITSLIAGLGVGGIAIALALQNILSDLFSSFAIYFDKPFVPGDFIITKDKKGTVIKIGIKTTRLKALDGEEIVIPNQELTSAVIQNFQKLKEKRAVINFGVTYETPSTKLEKIPILIKDIIENVKEVRFDRCHFYRFDDSALSFETVFFVLNENYNIYMDKNQEICYKIKRTFEKEGVSMAYPTRIIYTPKAK